MAGRPAGAAYVEVVRNTPLLLQIIFWYVGVFALLPRVKNSLELSGGAEVIWLNNRGLYMAWPVPGDLFWLTSLAFVAAAVGVIFLRRWAHKRQDETGQQFPIVSASLAVLIAVPGAVFLMNGSPRGVEMPTLQGSNFKGGFRRPRARRARESVLPSSAI